MQVAIWGKGSDHWVIVSNLRNPVTGAYGDGTATVTVGITDAEGAVLLGPTALQHDAALSNGTYRALLPRATPLLLDVAYSATIEASFGGVHRRRVIPVIVRTDAA